MEGAADEPPPDGCTVVGGFIVFVVSMLAAYWAVYNVGKDYNKQKDAIKQLQQDVRELKDATKR